MTPSMKVGIAGIVLGLILLAILPAWAAIAIIVIAAAIPVGGYLALDKGQRRRMKAIRSRERGRVAAGSGYTPRSLDGLPPRNKGRWRSIIQIDRH